MAPRQLWSNNWSYGCRLVEESPRLFPGVKTGDGYKLLAGV